MNRNAHLIYEENKKDIIRLYWNDEMSLADIAEKFSIARGTLQGYMSHERLLRFPGQSSRKYKVNEDFFEKIDTEQKAYWLGVIYADGNICHIRSSKYLILSSVDIDWLEQFKTDIEFTGVILKEHHKKFDKDIWKIRITSRKIYADLMDKGVTEAKSLCIQFPSSNIVPVNLLPHFIRGYFDGDGSVGIYQNIKSGAWKRLHVSIASGSEPFILDLFNWLKTNSISPLPKIRKRKGKSLYTIQMSLFAGIKFREYIYENATVYLRRKHDIFWSVQKSKRTFNDYNRVS